MTALDCLMDFASEKMSETHWAHQLDLHEYAKVINACVQVSGRSIVLLHQFANSPDRRQIARAALRYLKMDML